MFCGFSSLFSLMPLTSMIKHSWLLRRWSSFATLETKRELERKCVPQFFLGSLPWERAGQLLAIFLFVVPSNVPEVLYRGELALQSFGFPGYLSSFETSLWFVFRFNSPARQLLFWKFLSLKVPQSLRLFDDISHWSQSLRSSTDWNAKMQNVKYWTKWTFLNETT